MVSIIVVCGIDMNAFASMVTFLDGHKAPVISKQDYEVFQKEFIFDKLKGYDYGRAFCQRFDVTDPVVERLIDDDIAREMIEHTYIQ